MSAERPRTLAVAGLTTLALVVAGCGGDDAGSPSGTSGGSAAGALKLQADPSGKLRFDTSSLEAKAGKVPIVLSNPSDLSHNVSIEGQGVDEQGETVGKGGTSRVSATLEPGTYTFYCSVPGHRQGGMQGTLTVK